MKLRIDELKEELNMILSDKKSGEWERLAGLTLRDIELIKKSDFSVYIITTFAMSPTMARELINAVT